MEVVTIDNTSNNFAEDVFADTRVINKDFMELFHKAETVYEKIEIAKIMQSQTNAAVNVGQLVVNSIKTAVLAKESNLKYSGLIPM